jgi:hypothetical protein
LLRLKIPSVVAVADLREATPSAAATVCERLCRVGTIPTKKITTTNKMADDSSVFSVQDVNIVQAVSDVERIMKETIEALDRHFSDDDASPLPVKEPEVPVPAPNVPEPPPAPVAPAGPLHKEVVEKLVNDVDPPVVRKPEEVKPESKVVKIVRLVKLVDEACNAGFWCKPPKKVLTSTP